MKALNSRLLVLFRVQIACVLPQKMPLKITHARSAGKFPHFTRSRLRLRVRKLQNSGDGSRSSSIFLLTQENLRMRLKLRTLKTRLADYAKRGEIKSICYQFQKATDEGKFTNKDVLKDFLGTTAANFHRKSKTGNRYKTSTEHFYEVIMYWGGPRLANFISLNLCGPDVHSVYRWRKNNKVNLDPGLSENNFALFGQIYRDAVLNASLNCIPVVLT